MPDAGRTIDVALTVWLVLVVLSVLYVAWDAFTRNPELSVMRYGWVLVTLYTGPIGGALYVLSCQEPEPGSHERFITPLWKQGLGSTIHCLAGDATGIVAAATVTAILGLPMGLDSVIQYAFGFAFGLFIFQALFMRGMLGGSYLYALRKSVLPEWISMNAVMAGMVPVMIVLMTRYMSAMELSSLRFWGVMSLASLAGLVLAYPANVWLVAAGLKHGMGTERALGEGGIPVASDTRGVPGAIMPVSSGAMDGMGMNAAPPESGGSQSRVPLPPKHNPSEPDRPMVTMVQATHAQVAAVALLSLLELGGGVLLAMLYGDVTMRPGAPMRDAPMQMTAIAPVPTGHRTICLTTNTSASHHAIVVVGFRYVEC